MNPINRIQQFIKISLVVASLLMAPVAALAAEMVNINRADAATMIENWKGIGEKKARAIVAYRKKNGPFASINDLANVKGMGEGLIKNNRKYMSVSKGASKPSGKSTTAKKSSKDKTAAKSSTKSKDSKATKKSTSKTAKKDSKPKKASTTKAKKQKCTSKSKDKECKKKLAKKPAKKSTKKSTKKKSKPAS